MPIKPDSIHEGDCIEIMRRIPDKSIDMILCDLPYGITDCKWDTAIPLDALWAAYKRIIKPNGAIVLFGTSKFSIVLAHSNFKDYRYRLVWQKNIQTGYLNAKIAPLRTTEDVLVFYSKKPTYNPQMRTGFCKSATRGTGKSSIYGKQALKIYSYSSNGERYPNDVLSFNKDDHKKQLHSTAKPVALCEYLIKTYTNEGETVLDNCAGSGTTGVACVRTNRRYILIEKEAEYVEVCKNRIANALTDEPKKKRVVAIKKENGNNLWLFNSAHLG